MQPEHSSCDEQLRERLPPVRLVLDTNVWLDLLVFDDPGVAPISAAIDAGTAEVFLTPACALELQRVLAYPFSKLALDAAARADCLARCRQMTRPPAAEAADRPSHKTAVGLPLCRDPDDQKFLELARNCCADFLVTKDRALLDLARQRNASLPFRIISPAQFEVVWRTDT